MVAALLVFRGCLCLVWLEIGLAVVVLGWEDNVTFLPLGLLVLLAGVAVEARVEEATVVLAASEAMDTGMSFGLEMVEGPVAGLTWGLRSLHSGAM